MNTTDPTLTDLTPATDARQWVQRYADDLYRFAIARLGDEEVARDLVQETFLAALQQLHRFEGKSSERTWLTAILKHKIIDVYRKRASGRTRQDLNTAAEAGDPFFDANDGHWNLEYHPKEFVAQTNDPLHDKELRSVLKACMDKLPALWHTVFTMKHVDDESSEAICNSLSLTSSNLWVIMHRAKVNLRACLQKNWS